MKKFLVKLSLKKKPVADKVALGRNVHGVMNGNPNFISPSPTMAELKTATVEMEAASSEAQGAGPLQTSLLDEKIVAWDEVMTALGKYVDNVARGDETIILSAGMQTQKQKSPRDTPGRVTGVAARSVCSRELKLKWEPVPGALVYLGYLKAEGESNEQHKLVVKSSRITATVGGLQPGKCYNFVVEAVGSAGAGELSDVAKSFVL